jgi:hypothetical protein
MPWDNIVTFPSSSERERVVPSRKPRKSKDGTPEERAVKADVPGPNMHTLLFRSRDLILQSDEADLVRDVCFDIDKAQTKLKAIRRRLQGLQEYTAAELQLLTAADTKLTAAIVAALLSTQRRT